MMHKSKESSSNCHNELGWKQMQENARFIRLNGARERGRKGYVGVRQRASGRWVAEIKDTVRNIRVWLGTFETSEEAARAYDEAACILRGAKTRTNFWPPSTSSDTKPALPSKITKLLLHRLGAKNNDNGGLSLESSHDEQKGHETIHEGHETRDTFQISLKTSNTSPINASISDHLSNGFDFTYSRKEVKRLSDFDLETSWTDHMFNASDHKTRESKREKEGGERKEAKKARITDYLSLNAIEPTSKYTSLEIAAQEMSPGSMKTNPTDRMKYERSNPASIYGFDEISECLKLKLGTRDANTIYEPSHSWNLEKNPDEESDAYEAERVADKQQTSHESNYLSSNSATSSASIDGNELSLWSSLDLPPITVLFGAQMPSISF